MGDMQVPFQIPILCLGSSGIRCGAHFGRNLPIGGVTLVGFACLLPFDRSQADDTHYDADDHACDQKGDARNYVFVHCNPVSLSRIESPDWLSIMGCVIPNFSSITHRVILISELQPLSDSVWQRCLANKRVNKPYNLPDSNGNPAGI